MAKVFNVIKNKLKSEIPFVSLQYLSPFFPQANGSGRSMWSAI